MHAEECNKRRLGISHRIGAFFPRVFLSTRVLILPAVIAVTFLEILDSTVVSVSLPYISGSLSVSSTEAAWGILAYICANSVMLLLAGAITRRLGLRRTFLLSVATFAATSALCSLAPSVVIFSIWRALQGASGGLMYPVAYATALDTFPKEKQSRAIVILGFITTLAPTVGPVLGGWLTESFGWQLIFLLNVPVSLFILFILIVHYWPSASEMSVAETKQLPHLPSMAALLLGTLCFQIVLLRGDFYGWFQSFFITVLSGTMVLSCIGFCVFQVRANAPLVRLQQLARPSFLAGSMLILVHNLTFFGSALLLPLLLEQARGLSSLTAGLYVVPRGLGSLLGMMLANPLLRRIQSGWTLALSQLSIAAALFWLAFQPLDVGPWALAWPQGLAGVGSAVGYVAIASFAFSRLTPDESLDASAVFGFTASVGASLGVAAATTVVTMLQSAVLLHFTEHASFYGGPLRERERILASSLHGRYGSAAPLHLRALFTATVAPQAQLLATAMLFRYLAAAAFTLALLASVWAVAPSIARVCREKNIF